MENSTSSTPFGLDRLWCYLPRKSLEMERGHPRRNFHSGFDTCCLLQLSTNRFFRVNGKQPGVNFRFSLVIPFRRSISQLQLGPSSQSNSQAFAHVLIPGVGWGVAFAYPRNNPKTFDALIVPCNFGLDSMWQRTQTWCCSLIYLPFPTDNTWIKLNIKLYSCFQKGFLTNGVKLTRQCRKLLWVMVLLKDWMNLKVFQHGGRKQHKDMYSFFLVPCCWITMNLNQAKPNSYYPYQSTLSRTVVHFCGTTFVETVVYKFSSYPRWPISSQKSIFYICCL